MRIVRTAAILLLLACPLHAHEGWGIVIHERLGVIVSDIPGNTIWRIQGNRVEALFRDVHSHSLITGSDGALYGTNPKPDGTVSSVWRIDAEGRFSYVIPPASGFPMGLQSFLITNDGTIYSVNRYDHERPSVVLLRRERSGSITRVAGGFTGIDGMRQAAGGKLVVADGAYLRSVTSDGHVSALTPPLAARRWGEDLLGISSIRADAVHVADHAGRRVLRVSLATGQAEEVDRSELLWAPSGVEVTNDALYVLEHLRPPLSLLGDLQVGPYLRVRRVAPGASSTTLALVWGRHTWKAGAVLAIVLVLVSWMAIRRRRRRLQ